jgi:sterol desaturase/sphingolipid hydroxylase (fatty acid hydroxylase superfamily)
MLSALSAAAAGPGRWWILSGVFLALSALEILRPARPHEGSLGAHWLSNFVLAAACMLLAREVSPAWMGLPVPGAEASGAFALVQRLGGEPVVFALAVLALEFYAYASHRLQHAVFPLWRFHAVHHADEQVNAGTALRQHPIIYVAHGAAGTMLMGVLGLPLWVLPLYGLASLAANLFAHANLNLPPRVEAALRWVAVTPGTHRLHHSIDPAHQGANFGNALTIYDRLFGTYLEMAEVGDRPPGTVGSEPLRFGILGVSSPSGRIPPWPLVLPFVLRRSPRAPDRAVAAARSGRAEPRS